MECSFEHINGQYELGFCKGNVLRVKVGSFKKSRLTSYAKMRVLKNGGTTVEIAILRGMLNILSIALLSRVYAMSG